ncbi:MAG: RluA family pseudouridine synthase [gamma proteobacterium symbiont of Bathyaustriella thionipta]|nr:RluA family pseudouridine synthase [gamma proteobacterium symbiont of Bathyaustriella thionipta]MCU7949244.1 RluA family pseudouridine synthase [gamma proteobacterium symbiont of Bathyaustriella thionipta]MCU7953668.1 RluA family pseudouridine synthase [gamma proteobacterium symbiont of Bathyaustriella thionipta]MCU7955832.1 RluA family pseudouridine synthase [gamma proteobacterium symbiont of Bathyaustriella thionipta]MCU7966940.1 RluA family pseudouridine synthase [gamma proteobacterium sy
MKTATEKFEKHLSISNDNVTAIDILAEHIDFSRQKIKQIMQKGAVWLTQEQSTRRIRRASKKLCIGQTLHLYYDAHILEQTDFSARLIADEGDYSVWFKPSGMLSQGSKYGDHSTIYRWAETHLQPQRNAFLVHRLDKATSGLILIAHSKKAAATLSKMFSERLIDKYYKALVQGLPQAPGIIDRPLENKKAITKILSAEQINNPLFSLLDIQILTGRKHQIRQHLSHTGHPVVGDRLYGNAQNKSIDLCLTAYKIIFTSPFDKQEKHYELGNEFYPSLT